MNMQRAFKEIIYLKQTYLHVKYPQARVWPPSGLDVGEGEGHDTRHKGQGQHIPHSGSGLPVSGSHHNQHTWPLGNTIAVGKLLEWDLETWR